MLIWRRAVAFHLLRGHQVRQGFPGIFAECLGPHDSDTGILQIGSDLEVIQAGMTGQVDQPEVLIGVVNLFAELLAPALAYHHFTAVRDLVHASCRRPGAVWESVCWGLAFLPVAS